MTQTLPSEIIAGIGFIGRAGGAVKSLRGFRKSHHTVPDAANATTNAFLGKLCAGELGDEAEALFQAVRTGLGYKRREISLEVAPAQAVLTAKDFALEISYALEAAAPANFAVTRLLHSLRNGELAHTEEFSGIFAGWFSEITFALRKGARVEDVIDAIEALEEGAGLRVDYPADCRECVIGVEGVDATVRCTGATLDVVFPRAGAPRELIAGFAAVRGAFGVSRELATLLN